MNHPWQQPIRRMEVRVPDSELWVPVIFIRPDDDFGWEVITRSGCIWASDKTNIREVTA